MSLTIYLIDSYANRLEAIYKDINRYNLLSLAKLTPYKNSMNRFVYLCCNDAPLNMIFNQLKDACAILYKAASGMQHHCIGGGVVGCITATFSVELADATLEYNTRKYQRLEELKEELSDLFDEMESLPF